MIDFTLITSNLQFLNQEYDSLSGSETTKSQLYSRLAIIECCVWLEDTFDSIAKKCIQNSDNYDVAFEILMGKIDSIYGIHYTKHVRPMLSVALGAVRLADLEASLEEQRQLNTLRSVLGHLHEIRNKAAHTSVNITKFFDAPSKTIDNLNRIQSGLSHIWTWIDQQP